MNRKHKIIFVDDHVLILKGLNELFQGHEAVEVEGLFPSKTEMDLYLSSHIPDIIVMDIQMPGQSGLELCLELRARFPQVKLMLLTMLDQLEFFKQALNIGCEGYLLKSGSPDEILLAVHEIIQGRKYYSNELTQKYLIDSSAQGEHDITPRELDVIRLLCSGRSNKEIGALLFISARTVEFHRANIFEKLKISSIAELVKYSLKNKIIEI